jgi:hypothetical protein
VIVILIRPRSNVIGSHITTTVYAVVLVICQQWSKRRTSRIHISGTISCCHALMVTEYDTTLRFDVFMFPYCDKDLEEDPEEGLEEEQA